MKKSFFFYDLETSGLNQRADRIMQFAGQRTDEELNLVGEPVNILVKMTEDALPSPQAIMVTKITPQQTLADGMSEAEFCKKITEEIFIPNTVAVGYNTVRFDDEFMRATLWRNFYDPYEWEWKDGRSRWDMLDVVRLTRALRPEGIKWPVTEEGKATNRLELLTKLNGLEHLHAHDALSDVYATIAVAKLVKEEQPRLFDFLLKMRDKKEVMRLVNLANPSAFVYTSGRYVPEYNKTTVAFPIAPARNGNVLVFDLRHNLDDLLMDKDPKWFPVVKEMCYNKCPAVAPLLVLDESDGWNKINLSREIVEKNLKSLMSHPEFIEQMRTKNEQKPEFSPAIEPEQALYDGFLDELDRVKVSAVRNAEPMKLADFHPDFHDPRLPDLLLHYKGRNYPETLDEKEALKWEEYRRKRIEMQTPKFMSELEQNYHRDEFVAEELKLYFENIVACDY